MARINEHYRELKAGYLFPEIGRRVAAFLAEHPSAPLIRLGIGDVTEPLVPAVLQAMNDAVAEMGVRETFRGYGPERGYDFLRDAIIEQDYAARGVTLDRSEVFVSDGSKCDSSNIQEIFAADATIAVTDPVYPVYVDSNVMAGRVRASDETGRYAGLVYLRASQENHFLPPPPSQPVDVVYLCSPNNPTGAVADRHYLATWVAWARQTGAVIIFDAAYEAFIRDPSLPRSIYEIDGAAECAIEMRSFSKRAGFTGVRCAFTVVPNALLGTTASGDKVPLNPLWARRQSTKFNGVSYIVQRGAAAVYTDAGRAQTEAQVSFYMENAARLRSGLAAAGFAVFGGQHAPYLWVRVPAGTSSWGFFESLLRDAHLVATPGAGFGPAGEGYVRVSAFTSRENVDEALRRVRRVFAS